MRAPTLALLASFTLSVHAVDAAPTLPMKAACAETSRLNDRRELTCTVPSGVVGRFRFSAMFTGSHDDTLVTLEPALNDQPMTCDDGSKIRRFGEDGDVSLHCDFSAPASGPAVFKVLVKWSHAEYEDFDFVTR